MSGRKRSSNRDAWLIAWALTLLLHALAILGIRHFSPAFRAGAKGPERLEPVELVFSRAAAAPAQNEKPHFFSELPPNRRDAAPEKAEFLSNVTSRARDLAPGGDTELPRMKGEGDAPQVSLEPDGSPSRSPLSPTAPSPTTPSSSPATPSPSPSSPGASAQSAPQAKGIGGPAATPTHDTGPAQKANDAHGGLAGLGGSSDIHQPEMDNPNGNAALTGDVSLNTIQWDYAPWLQRFSRKLMEKWVAPPPTTWESSRREAGRWSRRKSRHRES